MADPGRSKLVIVEDEGLIAADLKNRLEDAGYAVAGVADSGSEALRIIDEEAPDLVLMDIRLKGGMDGIQVAERMRQQCDVPVVYLTAYEDTETLQRAGLSQAFGYIKKPIASASLRGSIEIALSKHRQECHLREQRDWFSTNFAAVPDAVVATDRFGRVAYLNPVAERLTGREGEQALGSPVTEVLRLCYQRPGQPVEQLPPVEDLVPVALLQGSVIPLPPDVCVAAGPHGTYAVEGSIAPRVTTGGLDGALIVFRDVTTRKFVQEQLNQENKQQALGRLAAGVARHMDLELGVVADETAQLLEALPPDSPLRQNAATLEMAAMDAFAVVRRLQAFTQQKKVHLETVRVNELLESLEPSWKRVLPGLKLLTGPGPLAAEADASQLSRAILSILLHARNWMRAGAGPLIETSIAALAELGMWVRIRIAYGRTLEDTATLAQAFEPYCTGHTESLPGAWSLIREMGGFLSTGIERGVTVTFDIYLSLKDAGEDAPETGDPATPALLLVEPNPAVKRLLRGHFERNGYRVLETATCEEALLVARLYAGEIGLAIANPGPRDSGRAELQAGLRACRQDIALRLLDGYWEERGTARCLLTLPDLLAWAGHAVQPAQEAEALAVAQC